MLRPAQPALKKSETASEIPFIRWQKQSLRTVLNRARRMLRKELEKEGIKDDKIL